MIQTKFNELLQSKKIEYMMQRLSMMDYKFMIAKPHQVEEILDLMCECRTKQNPLDIVFGTTPTDIRSLKSSAITTKVNAGRCFVITNKCLFVYSHSSLFCNNYYDQMYMTIYHKRCSNYSKSHWI